ncbi:hypothetical protein NFI96_021091 [Prochilodus magdalenae]|nr:hypothetical protein NFI96_021091 [Prochilodus magdalenae]
MGSDPDQQVESLIEEALKHGNFQALEQIVPDETIESRTSKCSKQFISKLDKLINRELDNRNLKNASVVFTILHKLGDTLVFSEGEGLSAIVSQGLVRKISIFWFERLRKIWIEAGLMRNELMLNLAEDFFDALMVSCSRKLQRGENHSITTVKECLVVVAKSNFFLLGTYQIAESLLHHIGKLASDAHVNILIQKEAVRKLNVILGKIPVELKKEKKILSSQEASTVMYMDDLASRILKGGDYDLQVALMEALCRMTSRAHRRELADRWFSMEFVATAFRNIKDSEFETDCRKFLNLVNKMQGDGQSVYSYPCLEVFLDKRALLMPMDENLKEFWIDFNLGSQSISFYFSLAEDQVQILLVEIPEGQWDTLCITENEIHSYTVEEKKDVKVMQLVLTEPVFVSSIEGSRLSIHFSSTLDILQATKKVYGEAKNKKFLGKTTTSVVKTTVQIIMDEGCSQQVLFPESQASSEPLEKTVTTSVKNSTPYQHLSYHKKDTQHHNQQAITPLRNKVSESCVYVSGSAGRKLVRSPFSCVMPATSPVRKAKVKPALEMVASSGRKKENNLRELLLARSSFSEIPHSIEGKENSIKQSADVPQDRKDCQEAEWYRRRIPVDKVLEMVQADQELEEEPLDSSMVPDSQPAMRKETFILPDLCHFVKNKRTSVSASLLPCPQIYHTELSTSGHPGTKLPQQPSSPQNSSGVLTHKELHAQLTQRLELVLREREQQGEPPVAVQRRKSSVGHNMSNISGTEQRPGTGSQKPTPAKPTPSRRTKSNVGNMNKDVKTVKAADSMVKQISNHYKNSAFASVAPKATLASQFNMAQTNRYLFKSWYPASAAKLTNTSEYLKSSIYQSKKPPIQHESSLTLSNSAKKGPPAKPTRRNVKKHLFSDTDTENMTEVSWLKSSNRRPKPKVADYTRQPVKPILPPADTTFETPNIPPPSPKVTNVAHKPKRKRRRKEMEQRNKTNQDVAKRKPMGRPQRTAAQAKSYRDPSDSGTECETDEQPPVKACFFFFFKLIIKQPEKPLRTDSIQPTGQAKNKNKTSSEAVFEQTLKENGQVKSKASRKFMKEKAERERLSPEQAKRKKKPLKSIESTKGQKESWASKISSICTSPLLSTNKIRSGAKSAVFPRSPLASLDPLSKVAIKHLENPQKKPSNQATKQADKKDNQSGETTTHSDSGSKLMEKKCDGKLLGPEQSKSRKTLQESAKEQRESWVSKVTSLSPSPLSIEKMRSAEKNAALMGSPITPLGFSSFSPVVAVSPPLELPGHLKGIQASSFYKTSGGQNRVKIPPHPPVVLDDAELSLIPSMAEPLIASTGRETHACSSPCNSPDLVENARGFLNSASHRGIHASFEKETIISLVSLSQSSHGSVNLKKRPECTLGSKAENPEFQSGPASCWKRHRSCDSCDLSEIVNSEEEEVVESKVMPSKLAIKMKPRKLFKPNDKPWLRKKGKYF